MKLLWTSILIAAASAPAAYSQVAHSNCAHALKDQGGGDCIEASSKPTLGQLFPLSKDLFIDDVGCVGIGTTLPTHKLHVNGNLKVNGSIQFTNLRDPHIYIYESGVSNTVRGLWVHSPPYPDWGMFYWDDVDAFTFKNNYNEVLRIGLENSRVGILDDNPDRALSVGTAAGDGISIGSVEYFEDGGSYQLLLDQDLTPAIDGIDDLGESTLCWDDVYAQSYIVCSDLNAKENVEEMRYGLRELLQLRPVSYSYKSKREEGLQFGLIAQDVLPVMKEVVKTQNIERDEQTGARYLVDNERLGINYTALVPVLIKAVQQQQTVIEQQDAKMAGLEARLAALERK